MFMESQWSHSRLCVVCIGSIAVFAELQFLQNCDSDSNDNNSGGSNNNDDNKNGDDHKDKGSVADSKKILNGSKK